MTQSNDIEATQNFFERPARITSHALVEVKKCKCLPFWTYSAVLLDISIAGFKIEFTGEVKITPGNEYWLIIPLRPLGIYSPEKLSCKVECRWFDEKRFRVGGVFMSLSKTDSLLIEQILSTLIDKQTDEEEKE